MLKRALEHQQKTGDKDLNTWYDSLTDEERKMLFLEVGSSLAGMVSTMRQFSEAVADAFAVIQPALLELSKLFDEASVALSVTEAETEADDEGNHG